MATEPANQGGQFLASALHFLKNLTVNTWRRLVIIGHYAIICLHQQRLCRAWRVLGKHIHQAVEEGEVNPMLSDSVQEKLARAQVVKGTKEKHYEAIGALREKIRASRAEATEAPDAAEAVPETKAGQEEK
jgi:hypothetical protein